jgi:hypothetical protein
MFRSLMLLVVATFFVSTLSGCIVVDGHPGKFPPGQMKKMKHH